MRIASVLIIVFAVLGVGFLIVHISKEPSQPNTPIAQKKGSPAPSVPDGRVRLVNTKIEFGDVDGGRVKEGMDRTVAAVEDIVKQELASGRDIHGTIEGSFRLEADGMVRMYLEGRSSLANQGESTISDQLTAMVFGKKVTFPALGKPCLVSWKMKIEKGNR